MVDPSWRLTSNFVVICFVEQARIMKNLSWRSFERGVCAINAMLLCWINLTREEMLQWLVAVIIMSGLRWVIFSLFYVFLWLISSRKMTYDFWMKIWLNQTVVEVWISNVVLFCCEISECIQSEDFTILNMEAMCFSEILVPAYRTLHCNSGPKYGLS